MPTLDTIPKRPLGLVMNAVETCGFQVGHVHDDLIFTEDNVFLLRMEDTPALVSLYFNQDCGKRTADALDIRLSAAALEEGLKLNRRGTYALTQGENNHIDIEFREG